MQAANLPDLESKLIQEGWSVTASDFVNDGEIPGQVFAGGYQVELATPTGQTFSGQGDTRADALRDAAQRAGLLEPGQPHLS